MDVATMPDFDDHHDSISILNLVRDSVVLLAKAVSIVPRELLAA